MMIEDEGDMAPPPSAPMPMAPAPMPPNWSFRRQREKAMYNRVRHFPPFFTWNVSTDVQQGFLRRGICSRYALL